MLRVMPGVPKDVAKRLATFVAKLSGIVDVRHKLRVWFVPGCVVRHGTSKTVGFGMFDANGPAIYIGCIPLPRADMSRAQWFHDAKYTIAHEFVHYQQFRDGNPLVERGVEKKAGMLVQLAERTA